MFTLAAREDAEVAIQLVVSVLSNRARVDDDDIWMPVRRLHVPRGLERSAETLGIVHVHLASVGAHFISAGCLERGGHVTILIQRNTGPDGCRAVATAADTTEPEYPLRMRKAPRRLCAVA